MRFEFPENLGGVWQPTGNPGVSESPRWIDFEKLALDLDLAALGRVSGGIPLAARAHVHGEVVHGILTLFSPPLGGLPGIGQSFEDALARCGNEDFASYGIVVGAGVRDRSCSKYWHQSSGVRKLLVISC